MTWSQSLKMSRRGLLVLGPAGALAVGALRPRRVLAAAVPDGWLAADAVSQGQVALGYWRGSDALPALDTLARVTAAALPERDDTAAFDIEPAQTIRRGDPRFAASGARVTVHGLIGAEAALAALPEVSLTAHFAPYHAAAFPAWSSAAGGGAAAGSAFTVPVDAEVGLALSLQVGEGAALPLRFALDAAPGGAKLRRGVYLVALDPAASWRRYTALAATPVDPAADDAQTRFCFVERRGAGRCAALPVLVLSIDHAVSEA